MNTLRDLDLATLEAELTAETLYQTFMAELYGKRKRDDQLQPLPPIPPQPSIVQPPPTIPSELTNGNVYG